ncbi:nuclear transport factor 2 family protein [Tardiphaga robiniae]|uniref:nuclear transport factor 2 family protein n=1 Tax=Tardiphaga robiniae TaxID=943830 RepID=UPI001586DBE4|nr:nuclear transport factor 2 family protein [Tardiphaga robiniae]NUU42574.1 nuclear transport factor 2 family protein [Tardiphaga robiniae]
MTDQQNDAAVDYDGLMQAHLYRVFGERDTIKRTAAIRELYAEDVVVYEEGVEAVGYAGVDHVVDAVLSKAPPIFVFGTYGPAVGHHGVGRMRWHFGPADGPPVVTGLDVVEIVNGRITTLHVFIDPPAA